MTDLPEHVGRVVGTRRLHGGSIAEVVACELADGRTVVAKHTTYDAGLEAEGLRALGEAGGPVPAVLHVEPRLLVLEHVRGRPDWAGLGRALAQVHTSTSPTFGWHRDNVIGSLRQDNTTADDWPAFHAQRRLSPYLGDLPAEIARRLSGAIDDGRHDALLDHDVTASLVHGDLWSGNVVDGRWLIDPAVHHADREFDLAFSALFGGIPADFWSAYLDVAPLDDGWEQRRPALQLYHLLVHVRLFGGGYLAQVVKRLDRLGW